MERYEAYKDSGVPWIGEISKGWGLAPLYCMTKSRNGATPSRDCKEYWDGDIPWMASGEINKVYVLDTEERITEKGLKNSSTVLLPIHSVMVALNGQGKTKGKAAILGIEACCNQSLAAFVCDESMLHYRYLFYSFTSMYDYLRGEGGQAQRDGISTENLRHQRVALPLVDEQRVIADYLDEKTAEIDGIVAETERSIELLREYRKAVISEAVTKGLDLDVPMKDSGIEWIGKIPEGWEISRVKNVSKTFGRIGFRGYTADDLVDEGEGPITLSPSNLGGSCLTFPRISFLSWEKYYESPEIQIHEGDVLFTKTGSSFGKTSYVESLPFEATINPQLLVFKEILGLSKFFYYITCAAWFELQTQFGVVGGTIPTIAQEAINNFFIVWPPVDTQASITDYLDAKTAEIDALIAGKERQVELLKEYRKSLISEAVTGKFKVPGVK